MKTNQLVSFLLELYALAVYAWFPYGYLSELNAGFKVGIAAILVTAVIVAWSEYAAPRATNRLKGLRLFALKATVFYPAAILVGLETSTAVLVSILVIVSLNLLLEYKASLAGKHI